MGACVLQNPKEKEFVDSELARDYISKLLMEVVIDLGLNLIVKNFNSLIVDSLYLEDSWVKSSLGFYLETIHFIDFPGSSYCGVIYFSAFMHDMIYACLT